MSNLGQIFPYLEGLGDTPLAVEAAKPRLRDRLYDAWMVLRGYELDYGTEEAEYVEPLEDDGWEEYEEEECAEAFEGPRREISPEESGNGAAMGVQFHRKGAVGIQVADAGETCNIVVDVSLARQIAVGILDAADEAEGLQRYVFTSREVLVEVPTAEELEEMLGAEDEQA